jgi:hypothetical protein
LPDKTAAVTIGGATNEEAWTTPAPAVPATVPTVTAPGRGGGRRQRCHCKRSCGNCNKREFAKHGRLLRFGAASAIGEIAAPVTPFTREAFGRLKLTPEKVNETGTFVSDAVHVCEIVVISGIIAGSGVPEHFAWSLAVRMWRRYKRRNSRQRFSRKNHGD